MKELVYFWKRGKKGKELEGRGYKLSARFKEITFTPETIDSEGKIHGSISFLKNENYIENFFGNKIVNLTAIVGINGSGKTQLLQNIGERLENKSFLCIYYLTDSNEFEFNGNYSFENNIVKLKNIYSSPHMYYYSPSYTGKIINDKKLFTNISIDSIAGIGFTTIEIIYQLDLMYDKNSQFVESYLKKDFQQKPIQLKIKSFNKYNIIYNKFYSLDNFSKSLLSLIEALQNYEINRDDRINFYISYLGYLLIGFIDKFKNPNSFVTYQNLELDTIKKKGNLIIQRILENSKKNAITIDDLIELSNLIDEKDVDKNSPFFDFIKTVSRRFKFVMDYLESNKVDIKDWQNYYLIVLSQNIRTNSQLKIFLNHFQVLNELSPDILEIKWMKLSYGERIFIQLFSRLYKYIVARNEFVIVMIDEGEIGFHPEWQRLYLKLLVDYCNLFNTEMQVLITTHSPLLLTDIPRDHILLLEKEEDVKEENKKEKKIIEYQTFAQNIHTILYDGFLENTLGEFAREKIGNLVEEINKADPKLSSNEWKTKTLRTISIVGEPIIRKKLEELYEDKFGMLQSKKDRIKQLENELEILKAEENNDSNQ